MSIERIKRNIRVAGSKVQEGTKKFAKDHEEEIGKVKRTLSDTVAKAEKTKVGSKVKAGVEKFAKDHEKQIDECKRRMSSAKLKIEEAVRDALAEKREDEATANKTETETETETAAAAGNDDSFDPSRESPEEKGETVESETKPNPLGEDERKENANKRSDGDSDGENSKAESPKEETRETTDKDAGPDDSTGGVESAAPKQPTKEEKAQRAWKNAIDGIKANRRNSAEKLRNATNKVLAGMGVSKDDDDDDPSATAKADKPKRTSAAANFVATAETATKKAIDNARDALKKNASRKKVEKEEEKEVKTHDENKQIGEQKCTGVDESNEN